MTDELYAAYIALIRHELGLRAGTDALAELGALLAPADPADNPPFRSPGIVRLRRALKQMQKHRSPDDALDNFAVDLRFLRQFSNETPVLSAQGLERLLEDVLSAGPSPKTPKRKTGPQSATESAGVIPFPTTKRDAGGDA